MMINGDPGWGLCLDGCDRLSYQAVCRPRDLSFSQAVVRAGLSSSLGLSRGLHG